ncbi:hypothetical protein [Thermobifida cellulosilytica]|uniref:hypothetical protein n=1 Tax=Thermobifida cellulosilytica TaxID=144786 RepID=UPI000838AED7|nr:hypothetical protein [Thermobifida cellulosilytica]
MAADGRFRVSPSEMAAMSQALHEPAEITRKQIETLNAQVQALGEPWGNGDDEISASLRASLPPVVNGLKEILGALALAFADTADNTLATARSFQAAEDDAGDVSRGLASRISQVTPEGDIGGGRR